MSDNRGRKSMAGAQSSTGLKDLGKSFFKANPPKRETKKPDEVDGEDSTANESHFKDKPGLVSAVEDDEANQLNTLDASETKQNEQMTSITTNAESGELPVKRRRRRKRRTLLTDTAIKAKKRADKKLLKEANETSDNPKKEGAESPPKKDKEPSEEPVNEKPTLFKYTPIQLLCDHILRKLVSKDPEEFFANPVQPSMAPDYLKIIEQPMDFNTIRNRIESNEYPHLEKFRADVNLICENATTYNQPNTVYYVAAQRLLALVKYYFSEQYLEYLRYSLPFGKQLVISELYENPPVKPNIQNKKSLRNLMVKQRDAFISDDLNAEDIIKHTEATLKTRLTSRVPTCGVGYLDNRDGALALNVLIGDSADQENVGRRFTLADVVPPLESGNPGLLGLVEPRLCHDYPISYTDPGPYASFAPQFDSTWATLNKYDSDVMLSCYGDNANTADALTLRQFVAECRSNGNGGDYDTESDFIRHVDALLDSLTDGEHLRAIKALEDSNRPPKVSKSKSISHDGMLEMIENIVSLQNLGLDVSYINDLKLELGLEKTLTSGDSMKNDELLKRTGTMITDLATINYARLGSQPPVLLTDSVAPTHVEIQLAQNVVNGLNAGIQALDVKPAEVVSAQAVHSSLGIAGDDDDYDYDLLREFMCVDDLGIDAK